MAQLIWSPKSLSDLKVIYEYIQQDSDENAGRFIHELIQEARSIAQFPLSGRVVPELKDVKTREKLYKNYRIIYRLRDDDIQLITFLHQARQLKSGVSIK